MPTSSPGALVPLSVVLLTTDLVISAYVVCAFLTPAALLVSLATVGFERTRDVSYAAAVLALSFGLLIPLAVYHRGALVGGLAGQRDRIEEVSGSRAELRSSETGPVSGGVRAPAPLAPRAQGVGSSP